MNKRMLKRIQLVVTMVLAGTAVALTVGLLLAHSLVIAL